MARCAFPECGAPCKGEWCPEHDDSPGATQALVVVDAEGAEPDAPDADQVRAHLTWLAHGLAGGCTQLELRRHGKTVRSFHDNAGPLLEAVRANPGHAVNVGVNPRPGAWAGSGYRDCGAELIGVVSAVRIDIDACRPLNSVTLEGIRSELDADNRERATHGQPALSFPPVLVEASARCARETPGLLSGDKASKEALREAIREACGMLGMQLRPELLSKLVTYVDRAAAGQPTSDAEHEQAIGAGKRVAAWSEARGWGEPMLIDSGNGAHLWFAIEPTELTTVNREVAALGCTELERLCRAEVEGTFPALRVDPWGGFVATTRLAGCWNRKGKHTTERPHRMSRIVHGAAERGDGKALSEWLLSEGRGIQQTRAESLAKRKAEAEERAKQYGSTDGAEPVNFAERAERAIDEQLSKKPLAGAGHNDTLAAMLPLAGLLIRLGLHDYAERFAAMVHEAEPHHWMPRQLEIEIEKALKKARDSNEFGSFKTDMLARDAERARERHQQRESRRTSSATMHNDDHQGAPASDDFGPTEYEEMGDPAEEPASNVIPLHPEPCARAAAPAGMGAPGKPRPYAPELLPTMFGAAIAQSRARAEGKERPISTSFRHLDDALGGGYWPGMHMLIAGTGVGKTQVTLQIAETAARNGIPIGLVELELDMMQLALRLLSENEAARASRVSWSSAYLGRATESQMLMLEAAAQAMNELPIYVDQGGAMAWSSDRLRKLVAWMRAKHPVGPLLVVVDFLQLVGSPEGEGKLELRERIGRAAYQARQLAREFGAAIVLVSSTARANYDTLSGKLDKAGLRVRKTRFGGSVRTVLSTDALIGTGKESGEVEYAADSLTVLLRPQLTVGAYDDVIAELLERDGKVVVAVVAKWRAGAATWFALAHEQGRFSELPDDTINSLVPAADDESGSADKAKSDPLALVRAVVEVVSKAEEAGSRIKNKTAVCERVNGRRQLILAAIKQALRDGYITDVHDDLRASHCKPLPALEAQPEPAGEPSPWAKQEPERLAVQAELGLGAGDWQ